MYIYINIVVQLVLLLFLMAKDKNDGEKELFIAQRWGACTVVVVAIIVNAIALFNLYGYRYQSTIKINGATIYLILLVMILPLFKYVIKQDIKSLGIKFDAIRNNIILILVVSFISYLSFVLLHLLARHKANYSSIIIQQFANLNTMFDYSKFVLIAIVVGPVIEEVVCRGIFYSPFRKKYGAIKAIIITSLFFAFTHYNAGLFPYFIGGLLLGYLYEKTESLLSTIMAHGIYNLLSLITMYYYFLNP